MLSWNSIFHGTKGDVGRRLAEIWRVLKPGGEAAPDFRCNAAQLYARLADCIRNGKPVSLGFDAAVTRHRLLDMIVRASETGMEAESVIHESRPPIGLSQVGSR